MKVNNLSLPEQVEKEMSVVSTVILVLECPKQCALGH